MTHDNCLIPINFFWNCKHDTFALRFMIWNNTITHMTKIYNCTQVVNLSQIFSKNHDVDASNTPHSKIHLNGWGHMSRIQEHLFFIHFSGCGDWFSDRQLSVWLIYQKMFQAYLSSQLSIVAISALFPKAQKRKGLGWILIFVTEWVHWAGITPSHSWVNGKHWPRWIYS